MFYNGNIITTDIPYYICYRFVRTVMERIASSSYKSDNVKLAGVIEQMNSILRLV